MALSWRIRQPALSVNIGGTHIMSLKYVIIKNGGDGRSYVCRHAPLFACHMSVIITFVGEDVAAIPRRHCLLVSVIGC